jgi:hypothetical protein
MLNLKRHKKLQKTMISLLPICPIIPGEVALQAAVSFGVLNSTRGRRVRGGGEAYLLYRTRAQR